MEPERQQTPPRRHEPFDVIGGLAIAAVGLAAALISRGYTFGTLRRMGPGFMPTVLSILLIAMGLLMAIQRPDAGEDAPPLAARPLVTVLASLLAFGLLVHPLGLVVATLVAVPISAYAQPKPRLGAIAVVAVGMAAAISIIFVELLNVPMNVWWW